VSANVAIRLLQVHVCIIYGMAGLSKLQGDSWWNGTALWGVIANYEFAPMQHEIYNSLLRLVGRSEVLFQTFLTAGTFFTLAFEMFYPVLIWRPSMRWVFLSSAILLHGFIGLFMGLKTFSFMMLVMNMAFLKPHEVDWMVQWFVPGEEPAAPTAPAPPAATTAAAPPSADPPSRTAIAARK
jgi:hypothetical protein